MFEPKSKNTETKDFTSNFLLQFSTAEDFSKILEHIYTGSLQIDTEINVALLLL